MKEIKEGDSIKFTNKAKLNLSIDGYYMDDDDCKDGWNKMKFMIVKKIEQNGYVITGFDKNNDLITEIQDHAPRKEDCEFYNNYNIDEIMSNLDKLKNKWKR